MKCRVCGSQHIWLLGCPQGGAAALLGGKTAGRERRPASAPAVRTWLRNQLVLAVYALRFGHPIVRQALLEIDAEVRKHLREGW